MADRTELNTGNLPSQEPKPLFSLLMACLAQVTMLTGVCWSFLCLVDAGHLLGRIIPAALLLTASLGFVAIHLLLRRPRPLLLLLTAVLFLSAGLVWGLGWLFQLDDYAAETGFGSGWVLAAKLSLTAAMAFGLCSQLKWEYGRFDDRTIQLQLHILLIIGVLQLWIAGQLQAYADWALCTFIVAGGLLAGAVTFKMSGLRSSHGGEKRPAGFTVFLLTLCGMVTGGAAVLAEPAGRVMAKCYDLAEGSLIALINGLARILIFVFSGARIRFEDEAVINVNKNMIDTGNAGGEPWGHTMFRLLFQFIWAAVILVIVFMTVRFLLKITVGRSTVLRGKRKQTVRSGNLWTSLKDVVSDWKQCFRGWITLYRNPSSVAAMIVWLEKKTRRNAILRRQKGETVRSFLLRLSEYAEGKRTGMKDVFCRLAQAVDAAYYSREGNLLQFCEESDEIRSFFRENP